jgi:hypothetical protein
MAFKLIEAAQQRWRMVNAPHLVALVRAGATFVNGKLVERPEDQDQQEGAQMADHLRTDLIADALSNAVACRDPDHGVVFNSDRGPIRVPAIRHPRRRLRGLPFGRTDRAVLGLPSPNRSSPR